MFSFHNSSIKWFMYASFLLGCYSLEAIPNTHGDIVAIQIEKAGNDSKDNESRGQEIAIEVQENERALQHDLRNERPANQRMPIPLSESASRDGGCPLCGHSNRQVVIQHIQHRPRYIGRVPSQPVYPRYGCGIALYPFWSTWNY